MGDFTTEQIYRCAPEDADLFTQAEDDDTAFAALAQIYESQTGITEFRGYSYDHGALLPMLVARYGDPAVLSFDGYEERPCIVSRVVAASDVAAHSNAILDVLAGVARDPGLILPDLHAHVQHTYRTYEKFNAAPSGRSVFKRDVEQSLDITRRAAEQFAMTPQEVAQVFDCSAAGGFYPGDDPAGLQEMSDRHAPRSDLLVSLCRAFGFLKTAVAPCEAAADAGHAILYLQTYGT